MLFTALESSTGKSCAIFLCTRYVSIPLFSLILPTKRILFPAACRGAFWLMWAEIGFTALSSCLSVGCGCPVSQPLPPWRARSDLPPSKAGENGVSTAPQPRGKGGAAPVPPSRRCLARGSRSHLLLPPTCRGGDFPLVGVICFFSWCSVSLIVKRTFSALLGRVCQRPPPPATPHPRLPPSRPVRGTRGELCPPGHGWGICSVPEETD